MKEIFAFEYNGDVFYWLLPDDYTAPNELDTEKRELKAKQNLLEKTKKKLNNPNFVKNAPKHIVEKEKRILTDTLKSIESLKKILKK